MNATLLDATSKSVFQIAIDELPQRLPAGGFFWLDTDGASTEELKAVAAALRIDADTGAFLARCGERARFELAEHRVRLSTWTVEGAGGLSEVHVVYARRPGS